MRPLAAAIAAILLIAAAPPETTAPDAAAADAEQAAPPEIAADPQVRQLALQFERERLRALIARTKYATASDDYETVMYRHHQFWTDAAAVAVYIITFFGLLCAGVQFRLIDRIRGIDVHGEDGNAGMVELPGGAKVSSPFLGIVILFISLGFFYLYLQNVYPIVGVAELEAKRAVAPAEAAH